MRLRVRFVFLLCSIIKLHYEIDLRWEKHTHVIKNAHFIIRIDENSIDSSLFNWFTWIWAKRLHFSTMFAVHTLHCVSLSSRRKIHFQLLPSFIVKAMFVLNRWDNSVWKRGIKTNRIINDRAYTIFVAYPKHVAGLNGLAIFSINRTKRNKKEQKDK